MSAQRQHTSITKNKSNMAEKNVQVKESFVNKLLKFFNKKSLADITFGMDLNTSDGQVLTVEREEGAPEVGDKASPDFQFHKGAIETCFPSASQQTGSSFQFHKGAIETQLLQTMSQT